MGKVKKLQKKGIFFTFIAITIMALFILVYTPQTDISLQKDTQAVKNRIISLDNYASDLENSYFESVLRAATYKTILSLAYYAESTGLKISDFDSAFSEVIANGTIKGVPIDSITGKNIMENNTLTDWSSRIIEAAKDTYNANTTIIVNNVAVYQTSPWKVDARLNIDIDIKSNVAEWNRENVTIISAISIEGFDDPLYAINTNGAYINKIKKSGLEFYQWDISQTREHLRNGTYVHWENSDAPNFLMRFGNITANSSCCGIESLVDPGKISPSDQVESYADYNFFNQAYLAQCQQLYNITGLWDEFRYFKLDIDHVTRYNITANDAVRSC